MMSRKARRLLLLVLLLAGMTVCSLQSHAAVSQSRTRTDAVKVVDMVCENWESDYFERAIVTPGSVKVKVDGYSRAFGKIFHTSAAEAKKAVRSQASILSYFRSSGGIYEAKIQPDGKVAVTAPYQMKRLVVMGHIQDSYGAKEVLHTHNDHDTILQFDTQEKARTACLKIRACYGDSFCYPDQYVKLFSTDSPEASIQSQKTYSWGVRYMQMDQLKKKAAKRDDLEPVTVAMIDSGINKKSFFFKNRKIHSASTSFASAPSDLSDPIGHGTHVAGVIAESTPENVKLMMIKVTNSKGRASFLTIREAFWYAVSKKADIINFSMGSSDTSDMDILDNVINYAYSHRIPIVAAAGNLSENYCCSYPASNKKVIAVSALTKSGKLASYSNYGSLIDFSAPGDRILGASKWSSNGLAMFSGTSMAAPHITSACSYVKMLKPSASVDLVIRELARLSVDFGARGKDKKYGFGCPRLGTLFRTKVVSKEIVYSGTPRIISTANTKKTIMLVWAQVREAKQYIIYRKKAGGKYSIVKTLSKGSSIWYDRTAKSGVKYTYRIRARFSGKKYSGYGKYAVVVRLKKPGSFRAYAGSGCLTLSWSKAKGAKKYQVQISRRRDFGKVKKYKTTGEKKMIRIADLDQGTYYVRIRSVSNTSSSIWTDTCKVKVR